MVVYLSAWSCVVFLKLSYVGVEVEEQEGIGKIMDCIEFQRVHSWMIRRTVWKTKDCDCVTGDVATVQRVRAIHLIDHYFLSFFLE